MQHELPRIIQAVPSEQEHITDVLRNQIRTGRIAHAYLFSGSRGTGKTSTARILARAVNCLDPKDGEPCGKCAACLTDVSESIDIIEMDAASNSKVDEMRALLEKAEFAPIYLKTKVYIIDEAHMLSKSANNALLKTLEEPPAHVVFILATTEPQALPATILSRCQRFDFRRLSVHNLAANTRRVLHSAGAEIEDEALMCIARAADGGMRDCLSIADQCLSFCGDADSTEQKLITQQDVLSVLGSMNADFLFDFADSVLHSDTAAVMKNIEQVVSGGRDIGVFVQDLSNHFRSLLLAKVCGSCADILDCTQDTMERYLAQVAPPDFGFTPDGDFPLINGEKGILNESYAVQLHQTGAWQLSRVQGGVAGNVVPDYACAVLTAPAGAALPDAEHITVTAIPGGYQVEAVGVSAHGSHPEQGENAIGRLVCYLDQLPLEGDAKQAVHFLAEKLGTDPYGERLLGHRLEDALSGPMSCNWGLIEGDAQRLWVKLNYRYPVTMERADCQPAVQAAFEAAGWALDGQVHKEKLYYPAETPLVSALLEVYRDATGDNAPPKCIGGGTYAKMLPNVVAFGPLFAGDPVTEHQPDECIDLERLVQNAQIIANAIVKLANLPLE